MITIKLQEPECQKLFLDLLFKNLKVSNLYSKMGSIDGVRIKTEFKKIDYVLNIDLWDYENPPTLFFNGPSHTLEAQVRRLIREYFQELRALVPNNDWIEARWITQGRTYTLACFQYDTLASIIHCPKIYERNVRAFDLIDYRERLA